MEGKNSQSRMFYLIYMTLEHVTSVIYVPPAPFSAAVKMEQYGDGMWSQARELFKWYLVQVSGTFWYPCSGIRITSCGELLSYGSTLDWLMSKTKLRIAEAILWLMTKTQLCPSKLHPKELGAVLSLFHQKYPCKLPFCWTKNGL